ncbi:MAG: FAD binding domain-containing protein [Elusimicrobia bacterium]|nr:FAD binding domain-containing protein [Elusimicrobiota bacterium]
MPSIIVKPKNLKEIWKILPELPAKRKYLSGGTDLVASANNRLDDSGCWIDITDISDLRKITETKDKIFIGAGVKIAELKESKLVAKWLPALYSAVDKFASPSLRNMATLGGNAGTASPCGDGICALCSERAEIILEHFGKRRKVPLIDFFTGPKKTVLRKDELIIGFEMPKWTHSGVHLKLGPRTDFAISKAAVSICIELVKGKICSCSIALASVAPTIVMARKVSKFLETKSLTSETVEKASEIIKTEISPITDIRSEAEYRREITGILLQRALTALSN